MIKILQNNNFVVYLQTYLATLQPLWLKVRWVSGLNQQFAKLPYGITVPGVRIPLSPLEKPGLPESGLFRSPAPTSLLVRETESGKAQRQRQLPGFSSKGPPGEGIGEKACGARLIPGPDEPARQGDRERESAEAATAARLFRKANPVHNPRIVLR